MAGPFVQLPTFAEYIAWVIGEHGCKMHSGVGSGRNGKMYTSVRIIAPNGKWVVEIMDQTERLTPTTIARLDRRLGLQSTFLDPQH